MMNYKYHNNICNKVTNSVRKRFDSEPVYNEKCLKTKTKSYEGKINARKDLIVIFLSLILIDFVFKWFKSITWKYFRRIQIVAREKKVIRYIDHDF